MIAVGLVAGGGTAAYLWLNAVGLGLLAVTGYAGRQWGVLLLDLTWALVSFGGLLNRARQ